MKNRASKYTFIIIVVLIVFNLTFGYVFSKVATRDMKEQIGERMLDISNTAAAMLDGDALEGLTKDDYDSPEYQKVIKILSYFQENIELDYIYCIRQVGEKEFVFGVDAAVEDPAEFGSPVVYTDALYNASKGHADVDDEPYEDAWGSFYSAYSPVYDSKGNVAGIVAVDFDAEWIQGEVRSLYTIVGSFILFALIFSIVLAIAIASQYKNFFLSLMDKMNDLSEGIDTLIREFDTGFDNEDYYSLVQIDRESKTDGMDLLGEKIRVMQSQLKEQIEVVRSHAYIDGLTGLNNRTSYMEFLQKLEKRILDEPKLVFSVVAFDINQLKIVNDDYGHDMGDKLIIGISQDITKVFDKKQVYRVGGDEFVAIVDEANPSEKTKAVKDIIARKNAESPLFHDSGVGIGLSIGYATYDAEKDRTYSEVFHRADNAMYADKKAFYETHEDRRKRR